MAAYNLLFLSHPVSDRWRVGKRGCGRIEAFIPPVPGPAPPASDVELVERHIFVGHLHPLTRVDTDIRYWLGSFNFVGQPPPARLLRFPACGGYGSPAAMWVGWTATCRAPRSSCSRFSSPPAR